MGTDVLSSNVYVYLCNDSGASMNEPLTDLSLIALSYVRAPYLFGGKDPLKGIDCSGMVELCLKKLKILPQDKKNYNSQMIFDYLKANKSYSSCAKPTKDCVLFFRSASGIINHVAIALNETLMIEATGINDICEINRIDRLNTLCECIKVHY
jgi:cell wall-associated NlpC family hydrolase